VQYLLQPIAALSLSLKSLLLSNYILHYAASICFGCKRLFLENREPNSSREQSIYALQLEMWDEIFKFESFTNFVNF